ncbi:MAG: hypothetical protein K0S02_1644 [Achromobacter mucicolens]|jgi:hypothetical protein|uniref:hypothetical protein n=1 Tax=Achromobacter mucicolens TaxID=1389922 RepID=UPI00242A408B|nr:hypothetical protein [Achromobacter mucicolens]MDF2861372.1 hypothetical protein [Achromobacter mucicolens]
MTYNLFVAYDLNKELDSSGYKTLFAAIENLGVAAKIQKSLWFVSSKYPADNARDYLKQFIDPNDYLIVVEASFAAWTKLEGKSGDTVKANWTQKTR